MGTILIHILNHKHKIKLILKTLNEKNILNAYWESGSMSKLDFISEYDNCIMPFEIKYHENKRSKSLHAFRQKYSIKEYIKFSTQNFENGDHSYNCPIYSLFCLFLEPSSHK